MYGALSFSVKPFTRRTHRFAYSLPPLQRRNGPVCIPRLTPHRVFVPSEDPMSLLPGPSRRGNLQIRHAILGVGAPEAVLVVVVALIVFGPKGLAEAARSIGKTLKSFSPTIRELAEVSTDLKSSLEQEIGLEEIRDDFRSVMNPPPMTSKNNNFAEQMDPDIEAKRRESEKLAWSNATEVSAVSEDEEDNRLEEVSIEDLEAELARRKNQKTN